MNNIHLTNEEYSVNIHCETTSDQTSRLNRGSFGDHKHPGGLLVRHVILRIIFANLSFMIIQMILVYAGAVSG